jgi:outer membrane protein TolC
MFLFQTSMNRSYKLLLMAFLLNCFSNPLTAGTDKSLSTNVSFETAVNLAQKNDPWLTANQYSEDALKSMSIAAGSYADPKMSLGFANLPTDSFDFNQEPMTQIKVGITQVFPRGDSLAIKQQQLQLQSSQFPYLRTDRQAKIKVTVAKLWFNAYKAQQSIALIESNRALFEKLSDVAQSRYSSAIGKTRQQDIVRAQLELTRLEDRLTILNQQLTSSKQQLAQWISPFYQNKTAAYLNENGQSALVFELNSDIVINKILPDINLVYPQIYNSDEQTQQQLLLNYLSHHPAVMALGQKIKASSKDINLAQQKYKPQWAVNASYGFRDDSALGVERSDFFSVGVTFDVPFFTNNRQDQDVKSAVSKTESIKTEKWLLLRKLYTAFEASKAQLQRTGKRQQLYKTQLLPQIHDQAQASLTAYTNDDGDFAEVVRSRIAVLNAEIDFLVINVNKQQAIVQLNYFFESNENSNINNSNNYSGEIQ